MKGGFTLVEHTADVGIVATGATIEEAFSWLAKGMFSIIAELDDIAQEESRDVEVTSSDQAALAVDWLNELLYKYEAEGFLPKEFSVVVDEAHTSLRARCLGEPVDLEKHRILTMVKAATYHGLELSHDSNWRIQVILDV